MKHFKIFAVVASAALFVSAAAQAATLNLDTTGSVAATFASYQANGAGGYNPTGPAGLLTEDLSVFDAVSANFPGLTLSGGSQIRVTFLGKEAGAQNFALTLNDAFSISNRDVVGSTYQFANVAGLVSFKFTSPSLGTVAPNGGLVTGTAALGFSSVFNNGRSVYAFFDDSGARNDRDFDDMVVRIDAVPLPAGAVLMLTALGGFGVAARRRRKA